jgi:hypothetical protein
MKEPWAKPPKIAPKKPEKAYEGESEMAMKAGARQNAPMKGLP